MRPSRRRRRAKTNSAVPKPAMPRRARQNCTARAPLAEAERKAQNLETQIATLSKLLNAGTGGFWPAVTEEISVAKGYEAALGAALGDDLDASTNPASPAHWAATDASDDPALAAGRRSPRQAGHGAGPSRAAAEPDRRRPAGGRRRLADSAETRPTARLEGRRSVALGRVYAGRRSPDPGGAAARRKKPPRRSRDRGGSRARRRQRLENRWRSARKPALAAAAAAESEARQAHKDALRKVEAARDEKDRGRKAPDGDGARGSRRSTKRLLRLEASTRRSEPEARAGRGRARANWNRRGRSDRAARHRTRGGGPGSCRGGRSERRTANPSARCRGAGQSVCRHRGGTPVLACPQRSRRRSNRRAGGAPRGSHARTAETRGGAGYVFGDPPNLDAPDRSGRGRAQTVPPTSAPRRRRVLPRRIAPRAAPSTR